jgi:hypothetical protein
MDLPWDNSHVGQIEVLESWMYEKVKYHKIRIITLDLTISCILYRSKNIFPCIVDEFKHVFGLGFATRGILRAQVKTSDYLIFRIPDEGHDESLLKKKELIHDPEFRRLMQKMLIFSELLVLPNISEGKFLIRNDKIPIPINDRKIISETDTSRMNKQTYKKWFGEDTSPSDLAKEMVGYKVLSINKLEGGCTDDNMGIVIARVKREMEEIIKKYDKNYIWYASIVAEGLAKMILC